jgi:dolichyl-phosphate beta-glucosyltransferase
VLPCYGASEIAISTVDILSTYLSSLSKCWEIIVVDDGGNDFRATPFADRPSVRLLSHPHNMGKGAAVRTGMLAARGHVRVFTDVDLPFDRELIPLMAEYITKAGFHMVIGDRSLPGSSYSEATSWTRRVLSGAATRLIGGLVTGGFFDTQCGIKALRGDVADALFPLVRIKRFAFDVEVIYLALKHHLDIKRVPVRLRRNERSSVRPIRDAIRSTADLLAIKGHQLHGEYRSPRLEAIVHSEQEVARLRHMMPA